MRTERGYLQIFLLAKKLLIRIWIYQMKKSPDGVIQRYKARWIVKIFQQQEGIDVMVDSRHPNMSVITAQADQLITITTHAGNNLITQ